MERKKIEILAPAGSFEAFRAALAAGADAVYAGGQKYGARAYAENFTEEELIRAIRTAHLLGRKFYLTVNTLLKSAEIRELGDYLAPFYENGLDAVIVQDVGVLEYVRSRFPGLDIHASTQMTITGAHGARFLQASGASRIVPARELSLGEIREIRRTTDLEIECFVHGALCVCYSGQCLLSSMIGGRSGNRGQCAQPCRQQYVFDGKKQYFLSPKDICTLELIPEMAEAGIDSFKIEGRMKKPEYVAGVTAMYRKYTDRYIREGREGFRVDPADREMLMDLYNRGGSSEGYYRQHNGRNMISLSRPNHAGVPALKVLSRKGRKVTARALTDLHAGDVIEITGGKSNHTFGEPVKKGAAVSFLVQKQVNVKEGTVLNRTRNESLIRRLREACGASQMQREAEGLLVLSAGVPGSLTVRCAGKDGKEKEFTALTGEPVQRALNRPLEEARVRVQMNKTGTSRFFFRSLTVRMDEGIFLPMQELSALRREALAGLEREILSDFSRPTAVLPDADGTVPRTGSVREGAPDFSILVRTGEQLEAVCRNQRPGRIYAEWELLTGEAGENAARLLAGLSAAGTEVFPAMPYIFREEDASAGSRYAAQLSGILEAVPVSGALIRNYEEYQFLREQGFDKRIILDHNLYVFQDWGKRFWRKNGVAEFTAPAELNADELEELGLSDMELTVYGYLPVMLSAQCVRKTAGRCTRKPGLEILTDRLGNSYPVRCDCDACCNVIYDCEPLCLAREADAVRGLAARRLRLEFTIETGEQAEKILKTLPASFGETEERPADAGLKTGNTGHFRRGIR